jgi:GDP-L-fucose synthase
VSRVLVTGGGGFLGSHLVERLERDGHEVVVARRAEYDLTSMDDTARLFDDADAELVFHLAAEVGGIGANRANPGRYWYANLMMGAHVLEQARLHSTPKLVVAGTICAYPKFAPIPFREDDLWNGYPEETNAPYGVAKKALLVGAQAYREQYGLNAVFLLPVNLYGPRDNFDLETSHVIPALIRKMVEAQETGSDEIVLWGDGSPTREFLFVDDCVEGLVLAAERYDDPDPVNLGTGEEIAIRDLAGLVARHTGFAGSITWDASKPNGQPRRKLDTSRAAERFGFRARVSLDEGVRRTVAWYREHATAGALR